MGAPEVYVKENLTMDIKELTTLLTTSATRTNQSKFIPWWEDNFENCTYRYDIFPENVVADIQDCVAQCATESLLAPGIYGSYGLTLFHLLVWHNFYDAVKAMLEDKRISDRDIDQPDHKGYGLTPFLLACCRGNLAMARLLLDHGADCCLTDKRGMNAYHFLAYPRFEGLVDFCQEHTASQRESIARFLTCDINQKDQNGLTPLARLMSTSYCSEFTWPLTEVFLDKGAETDYVDEDGNSLLMLAMQNGHITAALQLMNRHKELVHLANKEGITPFRHSQNWRNEGLCLALADCGAAPASSVAMDMDHLSQITSNAFSTRSDTDQDGISLALFLTEKLIGQMDVDDDDEVGYITNILHNALISDKKFRVLDTCQKAGLDFTMPIHFQGSLICLRDKCLVSGYGAAVIQKMADMGVDMDTGVINGRTPANIIASQRGNSLTSGKKNDFLSQAANFFSKESMEQPDNSGRAAIHIAAQNGHGDMIQVMIEKGVDVNLKEDSPAILGATPLHEACVNGHGDVVRLLMNAGADDTIKNAKGETPAHCAVMAKRLGRDLDTEQKIAVLKELKHLDIPREDGRTPLMTAQSLGSSAIKELFPIFLGNGADINRTDNSGMTVLILNAKNSCYKDTIKLLIQAGADINAVDNEGNTALYYALKSGDAASARYLIKKGADYNRPNNQGETPVQVAVEEGFDTVLELMTDIK